MNEEKQIDYLEEWAAHMERRRIALLEFLAKRRGYSLPEDPNAEPPAGA